MIDEFDKKAREVLRMWTDSMSVTDCADILAAALRAERLRHAGLVEAAKKLITFCPEPEGEYPDECGVYGCREVRDALSKLREPSGGG